MSIHSANRYEKPDFAFPRKVVQTSLIDLDRALTANDGKSVVRSLINYELAQSAIDSDSLVHVLARIQDITANEDNPCTKALLNTLQALIYFDIYQSDRWIYDRRQLPPAGNDNFKLWSGKDFRDKILSLLQASMSQPEPLQRARLNDYDGIIKLDTHTTEFYPTLYDFVASQALSTLERFSEAEHLFSISWLCRYDVYTSMKFNYQSPVVKEMLDIYRNLLEFHHDDTAPFINIDIRRLDFISQHIYNNQETLSAQKKRNQLLFQLYRKYENSPYAAEILIAANDTFDSDSVPQYYALIKKQLDKHPGYFRNGCLHNIVKKLTSKSVDITHNTTITPGDTLAVKVNNINTHDYEIRVYSVSYPWTGRTNYMFDAKNKPRLIKTIKCSEKKPVPFKSTTIEKITFDTPGCYIIVPVIAGQKKTFVYNYEMVHCTDVEIQTAAFMNQRWAYVYNPATGQPASKPVNLTVTTYDGKVVSETVTDKSATAVIPTNGDRVYAKSGTDRYASPSYIPYSSSPENIRKYIIHGFTDLALYHPGDTVQWAAVVQSYLGKEAKTESGFTVDITLRDANYQLKDSATAISDNFGRITGSFRIPDDELTGSYSIQFSHPRSTTRHANYGSVNFTVSDYKLPTYKIEVTDVMRDCPVAGAVTLKGHVETYSGFPLGDCAVNVNLGATPRMWWWRQAQDISFYSTEVSTDSNGDFTVGFPKELLESSPIPDGIFSAQLTATSPTGETQNTSKSFTTGKPYILTASLSNDIDVTAPVTLNVTLQDLSGNRQDASITYKLIDKYKKTVAEGSFLSLQPVVDWKNVPSGTYDIVFATSDSTLAAPLTADDINLYRPTDTLPPVLDTPLWIPVKQYTLNDSRESSILYGVSADNNYIHYAITSDTALVEQGWIEVGAGIHSFNYKLPAGIDRLRITLSATAGYRNASHDVTVVAESSLKNIALNIESFRDHITPGADETWTFKVTDRRGNGTKAAIMLDMYCKALDRLSTFNFALNPVTGGTVSYHMSSPGGRRSTTSFTLIRDNSGKCIEIYHPRFLTWDKSFFGNNNFHVLLSGRAAGIRIKGYATESASNSAVTEDEMEMAAMDAPKSVYASYDTGASSDIETEGATTSDEPAFEYRAAENPIALFRPNLTTDREGNLTFSFKAPDANTTWQLCATAFTPDMLVSTLTKEIVANKPVMVQPNLPRFLRNGDTAMIQASVMNNTDTTLVIITVVEIFDPLTSSVLNVYTYSDSITPHKSATISTSVKAGDDREMLGYRIKSSTATFADGEQSIIPILPSVQPVIETVPFYLAPDTNDFSTKLPEMPSDASVTLQYCENPVWYVVTALPGLRKDDSNDALSAAASIFSAAVAEGIINSNPGIASALEQWNRSDRTDSTLISMLERNQDLKTMLLNSTPWVQNAKTDTERMTRLALLFNKDEINSTYSKAIKQLALLEAGNGGWAWISQYKEPSTWITENILAMTGRLKQLGYMPDDRRLDDMIERAVKYLDRQAAKTIARNPDAADASFVLVRDYYRNISMSDGAKRLTDNTVNDLARRWKSADVTAKAIAALILYKHNHKTDARNIIASLREYAASTPEKGMWWPSLDNMTAWSQGKVGATSLILDAFNAVEPASKEIDLIRQWLVLQKEANDWGTSVTTSDVIASMLTSGSNWTVPSSPAIIKIGKKTVKQDNADRLLGYFRQDISTMHPSGSRLSIKKSGSTPSWGAVYCQFKNAMTEIKAASCPEVSIDKQLLKRVNGANGIEWVTADSITVGDIVQVNLVINANRDMDYVAITDNRGACFEPAEQLPGPIMSEGISFYRENRDSSTNIFVTHLPKGTYRLSYELYVNNAGSFSSGIASLQSQYAPALAAHSSGNLINATSK